MRREAFIRESMEVPFVTVNRAEDVLGAMKAIAAPPRREADAAVSERF
jgi:hypothetical protein